MSNSQQTIVFVHAPNPVYAATQTYGAAFVPLWAQTLGSYIPTDGNYRLVLYDNRFNKPSKISEADVFFFSGINQDLDILLNLLKTFRETFPKATYFIGGPICMSFDLSGKLSQLYKFDHICVGDGEVIIDTIIENFNAEGNVLPKIIRAPARFDLTQAKVIDSRLVEPTIKRYYGGVVEISRGCPFLCEFCDIRTLPDNNRMHNKSIDVIIDELDYLCRQGVTRFLLACDNFIGNLQYAEEVLDRIIEWRKRTGFMPTFYTWLTINLYKSNRLMRKMRLSGFDLLFIGIESFDSNSLLETGKVQNTATDLVKAVQQIQSFGFIVVAGLILGFDSDNADSFQKTLDGMEAAALLSGDPSLLVALPGTPLYRRMKLSGRLRNTKDSLGGVKYHSNIRFLMPRKTIIEVFKTFVTKFNEGNYQYNRLKAYFNLLERKGNLIPLVNGGGFGNIMAYGKALLTDLYALKLMSIRFGRTLLRPKMLWYVLKGFNLFLSKRGKIPGAFEYFQFWFFAWSNSVLKYTAIRDEDFDVESVDPDFSIENILPANYEELADEPIPKNKIHAQARLTKKQLQKLIDQQHSPFALKD